jgi:tol-pal system protein YbgF
MVGGKLIGSMLVSILIIGFICLMGCATTQRAPRGETQVEDVADIDELLGLTDEKSKEGQEEDTINDDDVLKLLGVTEESEPAVGQSKTGNQVSDLERQLNQYEEERSDLDRREQNLEDKINQQQDVLAAAGSQSYRSAGTSSSRASSFSNGYQDALQSYRSRQYREAIQKFEALLQMDNRHSLSDNCQYWIGESYYALGNYQQAIAAFQNVFTFSNSNKDDDAQLKLGLCYIRLNDEEQAKREFEKLVNNYPTSEYVNVAKRYIAQYQ